MSRQDIKAIPAMSFIFYKCTHQIFKLITLSVVTVLAVCSCCEWGRWALIIRHAVTAAEWPQKYPSLCIFANKVARVSHIQRQPSSAVSLLSPVLNVHDASPVIAFGTSAPCHFSATNVTELWPKHDILYSVASLIWLRWYHIWADLIRGPIAPPLPPSVHPCKVCERVSFAPLLASTHVYIQGGVCGPCACVYVLKQAAVHLAARWT